MPEEKNQNGLTNPIFVGCVSVCLRLFLWLSFFGDIFVIVSTFATSKGPPDMQGMLGAIALLVATAAALAILHALDAILAAVQAGPVTTTAAPPPLPDPGPPARPIPRKPAGV